MLMEHRRTAWHNLSNVSGLQAADPHTALLQSASHLFNYELAQGQLHQVWAWVRRRRNHLFDLNAAQLRLIGQRTAGMRSVQLDHVCGTQGRAHDFDLNFRPLALHLRDRWQSVAIAKLQGYGLPAVRLIQLRDRYCVQDGHHRLSVARALNELEIDAEVTVWEVAGPLPWDAARPVPWTLRDARPLDAGLRVKLDS
jgi:hypothetical protein